MNTLFIYGGTEVRKAEGEENHYSYCIDSGKIIGDKCVQLNDGERFYKLVLELRDFYSEYIYSINEKFLFNRIIYDKNISCYFFTDLANKRTELFNTYQDFCHLSLLKEKLKNIEVEKIIIDECSEWFGCAIKSVFNVKTLVIKNIRKKPSSTSKTILNQIYFFCSTIIKITILKIYWPNRHKEDKINNLYYTFYPRTLKENFQEEKFGELVKNDDFYLVSIISDGMIQSTSIVEFIKYVKQLKKCKNAILLESRLKYFDIIHAVIEMIRLEWKKRKLLNERYTLNGIDLTEYIKNEIAFSFQRLPRLFMYRNAIVDVFSNNKIKLFYYYLFEYSYGRIFSYILSQYFKDVETIGFQHGTCSKRKLLVHLAKDEPDSGEHNYLNHLPMPKNTLVEDEASKLVYQQAGYNNVVVMDTLYRLSYLKNIKRIKSKNRQVLLVAGLHDGLQLLQQTLSGIKEHNDTHYLVKLHPRSELAKTGLPSVVDYPNLKIVNGHISKYLVSVSKVIATYSSVGYEAYLLGIPVTIICLQNKINESPLLDIYEKGDTDNINIQWV